MAQAKGDGVVRFYRILGPGFQPYHAPHFMRKPAIAVSAQGGRTPSSAADRGVCPTNSTEARQYQHEGVPADLSGGN
jgi:hypothetical protein